jgi:hypothetical protein
VGLVAASWHFAYGIWLFCAKWGVVSGEKARKHFLYACLAFFALLTAVGLASLASFRSRPQLLFEPGTAAMQTPHSSAKRTSVNQTSVIQASVNQASANTEGR